MSSAPSVPGIEVGAPWLGGCEHVLTAGTLELLATLHRTFGPRRTELPESRAVRDAELAGGRCPDSWPGTKDMRQGDGQVAPLAQFKPEDLDTMQPGCCALGPDNLANPGMVVPTPRPCGEGPGPRTPLRVSIAYRNTCHLAHAQGVRDQPGRLLHSLLHPEPARELAERKTSAVLATGAPPMVTANPGCWMQVALRWRGWASRCPSRTSCRYSTHRSKPCRSDAPSLTRWTAPARRSGPAPGRRSDPLAPFRKEHVHARRLPAGL